MKRTGSQSKVVIVGDAEDERSLVATFLKSMGCDCSVTSSEGAVSIIQREEPDAVLVDLRCNEIPAERLIPAIAATGFDLANRMVVITDQESAAPVTKLVHGHQVARHISRQHLFLQLWPSLQTIFALSPPRVESKWVRHIARLIFDSFFQPAPAGVQALRPSSRQLIYEQDSFRIDLIIDPQVGMGRISIGGQVLNTADSNSRAENLRVALLSPSGAVAETTTNRFGEFELEFKPSDGAELRIGIGVDNSISLPLEDLDWAKKRLRAITPSQ
jgi:CheY-like chemotaxis protein